MRMHKTAMDRYRDSLEHVRTLDPAAELDLARAWRAGDERAGHKLVEASLPFVISIAREYRRWGIPLEDLVQQGNLGLLKAAAKFDPSRECRLVTYAAYWIRAEIREYVVHGYRIVRLGTTRTERRAMRAYRRSSLESPEHMAEISGMPLKRARKLWPLLGNRDVSLDVRYDDRAPAIERLQGRDVAPEDTVTRRDTIERVRARLGDAFQVLTVREQRIVEERIMADEPRTLEDLGREMGVSKERVRQLEVRARQKLRRELAEFQTAA
jgi:RNA polymerase sigma-32 factor